MKKKYLLIALLFSVFAVNAQNDNSGDGQQNEIKLNLISPLAGSFELDYERNLNRKSSLGISVFKNYDDQENDNVNSISIYYRRYFGEKYASGFFVEGFGMLSSVNGKKIYDPNDNSKFTRGSDVIDFSPGLGFGNKWVTKSGFTFEANLGWGKLLFNANKTDHTAVARFGFHVGYRF